MSRQDMTNYHLARLLIILRHFGPSGNRPLKGLTKLAKLDFLLRYPSFTDRLLSARGASWPIGAEPTESEKSAVESRMIRYKYGPWDDRYYPLLGTLVGLGLAEVSEKGRSIIIQLTEQGAAKASDIASTDEWSTVDLRAQLLRDKFNFTGTKLKNIIYEELPDVVDRPHRVEI